MPRTHDEYLTYTTATVFVDDTIESVGDALETIYGDEWRIGVADDVAVAIEYVITWADHVLNAVRPDLYRSMQERTQ